MTKETEKTLVIIYAEYQRRRSFGTSRREAARFTPERLKAIDAFSSSDWSDIRYSLFQLKKLGYLKVGIYDDVELLDLGIEYMESKPKEFFTAFAGALKDLIPIVLSAIGA